jgi:RNA polymerase sigma-70 factor (ECF subfamily)
MPESEDARVEVLVSNYRRFRSFLEQRVGSAEDAEDILQSAYLTASEKGDSIRRHESSVAWFYRLLRNALADHYRRHHLHRRATGRAAASVALVEDPDRSVEEAVCRCVLELLPTLKDDYASLIRRVDLEEATIADVASEMGITSVNARVKLHRARRALRRQLELSCGSCAEHGCLDCSCRHDSGHSH